MNPKGDYYNPCDHGMGAKMWECLRRNSQFKKALAVLRTENTRRLRSAPPVASNIPEPVLELYESAVANSISSDVERHAWLELPEGFQRIAKGIVDRRPRIQKVEIPPTATVFPDGFRQLMDLAPTHVIVAVPRKTLREPEADAVLRDALSGVDYRYAKEQYWDGGGAFGAPKQWRHFLLVEEFAKSPPRPDKEAIRIAAVLGHDSERFRGSKRSDRDELAAICLSMSNRGQRNNVRTDFAAILRHIKFSYEDLRRVE